MQELKKEIDDISAGEGDTTISFPIDDDLVYREPIMQPQEPLSVSCIICGEGVEIYNINVPWMICDNCKNAVLYVREKLKGKGE